MRHLTALLLLVATLPACGIVFGAGFDGTEVFRDLDLQSDFVAGRPIAVALGVRVSYPVPIAVSCRYESTDLTDDERAVAFNERAVSLFETVLEARPGSEPGEENDAADQTLEFEFAVSEPGDYFIACFTVAAPENGIGESFTITPR